MVEGASKENLGAEVTLVIEIWSADQECAVLTDSVFWSHLYPALPCWASMFRASRWWLVSSCCACRGKRMSRQTLASFCSRVR